MTGFGAVLLLAGVILLFAGLGQSAQNKAFRDAQVITGTVIDKRKRDLKNGTAYELTVTYTVDGVEYNKVVGVKLTEYKKIDEGEPFILKYRPDKPYKAVSPDTLNSRKVRTILIFGAVMSGIGVALLFAGELVWVIL